MTFHRKCAIAGLGLYAYIAAMFFAVWRSL